MESLPQTTAERLIEILHKDPWNLHNYAQIVDFCAYLVGIPEGKVTHLNHLSLAEREVCLERLGNCAYPDDLKAKWLATRLADHQTMTAAQVVAEGEAWLR